jgi:hypothetical protein
MGPLPSAVLSQLMIKFDVSPEGKVTGLSFNIGPDVIPMAKKAPAGTRGGRE